MRRIGIGLIILGFFSVGWSGWNQDITAGRVNVDRGVYVKSGVPANIDRVIYANGTTLYWNGSVLGAGAFPTITDNGTNVGIGSTSPQAKLDVEGGVYFGNGNVGIGTASPQSALDVNGTITSGGMNVNGTNTTQFNGNRLIVGNEFTNTYASGRGDVYIERTLEVDGGAYLGTASITGNVGIGTATGRQLLDVDGVTYIKGNVGINALDPLARLYIDQINGSGETQGIIITSSYTSLRMYIEGGSPNRSVLKAGSTGAGTILLDTSSTAGVGINTSSPGAALDIGGGSRGHASPTDSLLVKGSVEVDTGVYVDGGIYNINSQGGWWRQPDGGCSKCGPDAAGTSWVCVDITCSTAPGL